MEERRPSDVDLDAAHLRPPAPGGPRPSDEAADVGDRLPWEGARERGLAAAFVASWWRLVRAPVAAWAAVPAAGGARRPASFAALCGATFGVVSELVDSGTVALMHYGGIRGRFAKLLQLDIAGQSLDWLPLSALSVAGCLLVLLVSGPLFLLVYSALVVAWTTILHGVLWLLGGFAAPRAGYEGTLRAVCYSQVAMVAAMVPWVGDPSAILWSFALQVPGLANLHGCGRTRARLAVGLPAAALVAAGLWFLAG